MRICDMVGKTPTVSYGIASILYATILSGILIAQDMKQVRMIPYSLVPIAKQLLPTDKVVVIVRDYDSAVADREPTVSERITEVARRADAVALVDVDKVSPELVDGGAWIRTTAVGTVQRVIKASPRFAISQSQRIELSDNGGELKIEDVVVRTEAPPQIRANRRFLFFMRNAGPPLGVDLIYTPLAVSNDKLVDLRDADWRRGQDLLSGLSLTSVIAQIQKVPDRDQRQLER